MKYKVETFTFFQGWINCWTDEAENPVVFDSRDEAEAELDEFLRDQEKAFKCGDMAEAYSSEDFRVTKLEN